MISLNTQRFINESEVFYRLNMMPDEELENEIKDYEQNNDLIIKKKFKKVTIKNNGTED